MKLQQKKNRKVLSIVEKMPVKVIEFMKVTEKEKARQHLMPPLNSFNTGFLKAKEHDPL